MTERLIIDETTVYEVDEDCLREQQKRMRNRQTDAHVSKENRCGTVKEQKKEPAP